MTQTSNKKNNKFGKLIIGFSMKIENWSLIIFVLCFFLFIPTFTHAATLSKAPNNLGLVGYWPMNEGTGTTVGDFSGKGSVGSITNGVWVNGKYGKALSFNGSNSKVSLGTSDNLRITGPFSITAWVYIDTVPDTNRHEADILSHVLDVTSNGNWTFHIGTYNGQNTNLVFSWHDGSWHDAIGTSQVGTSAWKHVAVTYNGATMTMYIDGKADGTPACNISTSGSGFNNTIGTSFNTAGAYYFDGMIDEVRMYNRALSAAEVAKLYGSGSAKFKTPDNRGLVGYWSFNEGTSTKAMDYSGKGNTGTITNATWVDGKLGEALRFDGNGDYIRLPLEAYSFVSGGNEITMGGWFKGSMIQSMIRFQPTGIVYIVLGWGTTNPLAIISTDGATNGVEIDGNVQDGNWHYVAMTWKRNTINGFKIYVDGVVTNQRNSADVALPTLTNQNPPYLGSYIGSSEYTNGLIDDVRIYNRELSAAEIQGLYQSGAQKINSSQNVTNSTLDSSLVGLWSFNGPDISGATAYDRSSSGVNGTISGAVKTIGKIGQALKFNGTSDTVVFSAAPTLVANNFTLTAWVKPELPQGSGLVIYNGNDTAGYGIGVGAPSDGSGSTLFGLYGQVAWLNSGATLTNGRWTHIAMVRRNNTTYFYIDGVEDDSTFSSTPGFPTSDRASIGFEYSTSNVPQRYYKGSIDEARVYNRALSAAEIKQLYNLGK